MDHSTPEESIDTENLESDAISMDKVTQLQDFVDNMALGMFNSLRLLPLNMDGKSADEKCENLAKIKDLAQEVLKTINHVDGLIEGLPGANKPEKLQLEELAQLQLECDEAGKELETAAKEAELWMEKSRESMRIVADNRLQYR